MKKFKVGDRVALKGTVIDHHGDYIVARMDGFYGNVQYKYRMSVAEEPYWIKLRPKKKPKERRKRVIPQRQILYFKQVMALVQEAEDDLVGRVKFGSDISIDAILALQDLWFTLWQDLCECSKKLKEIKVEEENDPK